MRLNRVGITGGVIYLGLGLLWVGLAQPPAPAWVLVAWFAAVAVVEAFIPGEANQVSLARATWRRRRSSTPWPPSWVCWPWCWR